MKHITQYCDMKLEYNVFWTNEVLFKAMSILDLCVLYTRYAEYGVNDW